MIIEQNQVFLKDYTKVYTNSSQFPKEAMEFIPDSLVSAIDEGNALFFKSLKNSLPLLYNTLIHSCSPIVLLEFKFTRTGLNGLPKELVMYWWGLACNNIKVILRIPSKETIKFEPLLDSRLSLLPGIFHCCYNNMNGLAIVDGVGSTGFDLPTQDSDWRKINDYCSDFEIDIPKKWAKDNFGHDEIRVFIKGSQGHLFLIDCHKKPSPLFYIKDNDFSSLKQIEKNEVMDKYFSDAVLGFPDGKVNL